MSDQQHTGGETPQQDQPEQLDLLTTEDRVKREVAVIFGRHELVTSEGTNDLVAVADLVYPVIRGAIAEKPGDRAKVGITKTNLMERFFPEVPGPTEWIEYEDEKDQEFHKKVYEKIKAEVWRVLSVNPDGLVQMRLGANGGFVLCRSPEQGGRPAMAYVTRNRKCIDEDNNTPAIKKAQREINKAAALAALAIDRVPEHAQWFNSQYSTGMKEGIESGKNKVLAARETSSDENDG